MRGVTGVRWVRGGTDSCHDLYICVANNGVTLASVSCAINGEI